MSLLRAPIFCLVIAAGVIVGTPVNAEQVDLFCQRAGASEGSGLNVSIDLSAGTVTEWPTGEHRGDEATQTATITSDQVSWTWVVPNRTFTMTLDRTTGLLKQWWDYSEMGSASLTCKKASPVF